MFATSRGGGVFQVRAEDGGGFERPCGDARVGQGVVKDYGWGYEGGFVGVDGGDEGSGGKSHPRIWSRINEWGARYSGIRDPFADGSSLRR